MNNIESNLNSRLIAALAMVVLLFALAAPAGALAQDPSVDQYAEGTSPGVNGDEAPEEDPVPNSGSGGNPGGAGGDDDGGGGGSSVESILPDAPVTDDGSSAAAPAATGGSSAAATSTSGSATDQPNKAQRDLAAIAVGAEQERAATEGPGRSGPEADANATTELLRTDSGGGPGMGIFLWILLGGTLAWAVASGVLRHRQGGQTA